MDNRSLPTRALAHPLFWTALAVFLVNDHLLKGSDVLPGLVTGKLSDVAGLLVAPSVVIALVRCRTLRGAAVCYLAVGLLFCLQNLLPVFARGLDVAMSWADWRTWSDPTDLVALPALWLGWRWFVVASAPAPRPAFARAGIMVGAIACLATSVYEEPELRLAPSLGESAVPVTTWPTVHVPTKISLAGTTVTLETDPDGASVPGRAEVVAGRPGDGAYVLRFIPAGPLAIDTDYRLVVEGKALEGQLVWMPGEGVVELGPDRPLVVPFTTRSDPRVRYALRIGRQKGEVHYVVSFSQAMDATTFDASTVRAFIAGSQAEISSLRYQAASADHELLINAFDESEAVDHLIELLPGIRSADGVDVAGLPRTVVPDASRP